MTIDAFVIGWILASILLIPVITAIFIDRSNNHEPSQQQPR